MNRHRHMRMLSVFMVAMVALIFSGAAPEAWAKKNGKKEMPFSEAKIIIEFNSSGPDVGVQVSLDGEPWERVNIEAPDGRKILDIRSSGSLRKQGLTELFFESSEPTLDELSIAEFLARFPKGKYEFEGKTIDGIELEGTATLSHAVPAAPSDLSVQMIGSDLIISWGAVTGPAAGFPNKPIVIVAYQVVVDGGNPSRRFDVKVPAGATQVTVPPEFLEPSTEYTFEVLAIDQGGNQTITEGEPFTFLLP